MTRGTRRAVILVRNRVVANPTSGGRRLPIALLTCRTGAAFCGCTASRKFTVHTPAGIRGADIGTMVSGWAGAADLLTGLAERAWRTNLGGRIDDRTMVSRLTRSACSRRLDAERAGLATEGVQRRVGAVVAGWTRDAAAHPGRRVGDVGASLGGVLGQTGGACGTHCACLGTSSRKGPVRTLPRFLRGRRTVFARGTGGADCLS